MISVNMISVIYLRNGANINMLVSPLPWGGSGFFGWGSADIQQRVQDLKGRGELACGETEVEEGNVLGVVGAGKGGNGMTASSSWHARMVSIYCFRSVIPLHCISRL